MVRAASYQALTRKFAQDGGGQNDNVRSCAFTEVGWARILEGQKWQKFMDVEGSSRGQNDRRTEVAGTGVFRAWGCQKDGRAVVGSSGEELGSDRQKWQKVSSGWGVGGGGGVRTAE